MPYKKIYVKPRVLMKHNGQPIYCTYEGSDWDQEREFVFSTVPDPETPDLECYKFDVRFLAPKLPKGLSEISPPGQNRNAELKSQFGPTYIKALIMHSLNQGLLRLPTCL